MSRKHPQNGPSFSNATYKPKPMTDEELAHRQAKEKAIVAELTERGRKSREFSAKVKKFGDTIPVRGPAARRFWDDPLTQKKDE
jgi:hypothetical protein